MDITFTNTSLVPDFYAPKPASQSIPEWYKNLESYMSGLKLPDGKGQTTGTIKRCMPVFDAIVGGYILYTYVDVYVTQKDGKPWYEWPSFEPIAWHPVEQAPTHPEQNGAPYPKWINPWSISTPKGYSVLFVQPFHRKSIFTILPGVVDTDEYTSPVNFPFILNDVTFEGLIPAGTPMAQVIPFKRDVWEMQIGTEKNFIESNKATALLRSRFFDSYKTFFRQTKEYK
jgi:hypothetical protein